MNSLGEYPTWDIIDLGSSQEKILPDFLETLCNKFSDNEKLRIKEAYRISIEAHAGQVRKSGKGYITHIESIISDILPKLVSSGKVDLKTEDIIVTLLHDVLEDHPRYFDTVYTTFGYDIIYRIFCLSKPNKELFEKWKEIIAREPDNIQKKIRNNPIYKLWEVGLSDSYDVQHRNKAQLIYLQGIVWESYNPEIQPQVTEKEKMLLKKTILLLTNQAREEYFFAENVIGNDTISDKDKQGKIDKKWGEFLASLQLLMLSGQNLPIKFADKIHNLSDVDYRQPGVQEDQTKMQKKTQSILRTTDIYEFLAVFHNRREWLVHLSVAVAKSRATLIIPSAPSLVP